MHSAHQYVCAGRQVLQSAGNGVAKALGRWPGEARILTTASGSWSHLAACQPHLSHPVLSALSSL